MTKTDKRIENYVVRAGELVACLNDTGKHGVLIDETEHNVMEIAKMIQMEELFGGEKDNQTTKWKDQCLKNLEKDLKPYDEFP